uniref:C2H2-type domain-containing protein n=1 Tax=Cyprinodon variegatus TaxID=28743 RepID=A0A3Q2CRL1_CYPVA
MSEPEPLQIKEKQQEPEHPWTEEEIVELPISELKEQLVLFMNVCPVEKHRQRNLILINTRIHTGEKPFSCKICNKNSLTTHMRIHTGENPFQCLPCGKRFTSNFTNKSNLYTHLRIHTGVKPFSCLTCGKRFTLKSPLTGQIIHIGEKLFPLLICDKCFKEKVI